MGVRQGWAGRLVRQEQAQGILVAALGMLAGYFGYDETGAVREAPWVPKRSTLSAV